MSFRGYRRLAGLALVCLTTVAIATLAPAGVGTVAAALATAYATYCGSKWLEKGEDRDSTQ